MTTYNYRRSDFWRALALGIAVGLIVTPFIAVQVADIVLNQDRRGFVPHNFYLATWAVLMVLCAITAVIIARKRARFGTESIHARDSRHTGHPVIAHDIS